jgi:lipopolysaccharide export system ATP-binding protein
MKHRLPKPRSAKAHRKKRVEQAELEMTGEQSSPSVETLSGGDEPSNPTGVEETAPDDSSFIITPPPPRPVEPDVYREETEARAPDESEEEGGSFILPPAPKPSPAPEDVSPSQAREDENGHATAPPLLHPGRSQPPPLPLAQPLTFQPIPGHGSWTQHGAPAAHDSAEEHAPLLIQTNGLVKQYGGRRVVNGVDIHVRAGEVVGLLGKNGAGKTTTFYMIVGLVPPTLGHVYMGEEDVTHMPMYRRARRGIGYLPQEESIFRKLTVEENLLAILETLPMTEEERDARCDELLKDFGLEQVRDNVALTLSGGEKRRVTIARALVTSPTLLLLDEPFSGVDPMAVHDIQEIIANLKERGLGVLITDHNVRETLSVVDRAYIIDEGRVLTQGSREFIINDPTAREIYLGHRFSM